VVYGGDLYLGMKMSSTISRDDALDLIRLISIWVDCRDEHENREIVKAIKEILENRPISWRDL
jgi:cobalamin biosynthesis protein CbiG